MEGNVCVEIVSIVVSAILSIVSIGIAINASCQTKEAIKLSKDANKIARDAIDQNKVLALYNEKIDLISQLRELQTACHIVFMLNKENIEKLKSNDSHFKANENFFNNIYKIMIEPSIFSKIKIPYNLVNYKKNIDNIYSKTFNSISVKAYKISIIFNSQDLSNFIDNYVEVIKLLLTILTTQNNKIITNYGHLDKENEKSILDDLCATFFVLKNSLNKIDDIIFRVEKELEYMSITRNNDND